ncbi:hypothetical protein DW074_12555 [Ruminococcus sp. AF46-10NS]|nr:hypothetical protein DW074_12555 [Ruminococcus sp. AF46-10NS]
MINLLYDSIQAILLRNCCMFFSILAHFTDDNEKNTIHEKYNWKICQIYQEKLLFFGRITLTNEG